MRPLLQEASHANGSFTRRTSGSYFWSREPNAPPHVHLDCGNASAKVWLESVMLASNVSYPAHELGVILRLVREHLPELLRAWHEFFGTG